MNRDPGMQPERTALAWTRTSLAMAVNAMLVLRSGMQHRDAALITLGIVLSGVAAALFAIGSYRRRELAVLPRAPRAYVVWGAAASAVLAGFAALLALLA